LENNFSNLNEKSSREKDSGKNGNLKNQKLNKSNFKNSVEAKHDGICNLPR
jgi:hypothetical protein